MASKLQDPDSPQAQHSFAEKPSSNFTRFASIFNENFTTKKKLGFFIVYIRSAKGRVTDWVLQKSAKLNFCKQSRVQEIKIN
jgi:hypothetical protein